MITRVKFLGTFAALSALPLAGAAAQIAGQQPVVAAPPRAVIQPPPAAVIPPPPPVIVTPPIVLPPPMWDPRDAQALLFFIQGVGSEGLDPRDYDPAGLIAALRSGNPMLVSQTATDRFNQFQMLTETLPGCADLLETALRVVGLAFKHNERASQFIRHFCATVLQFVLATA